MINKVLSCPQGVEIIILANPKRELGFYLASNPYLKKIKLKKGELFF
jgi:hypothetical protein